MSGLDTSGVTDSVMAALMDAGEFLLQKANETIPFDEGTMARSGQVTKGDGEVVVSYDTPYAVVQHEDTRIHHTNGRRAKWLQQTLNEQAGTIRKYVADRTGLK